MFFRRELKKKPAFGDYVSKAREAGFTVDSQTGNRAKISRGGVAVVVEDQADAPPKIVEHAGVAMGGEIASLVDGGYQKFLQAPSGKRRPALAEDLRAIHAFQEDLTDVLGLDSAYNESLGTVSNKYIYDRVEERDTATPKEPWKVPTFLKIKG